MISYKEFNKILVEKVVKRGNSWVVTNEAGTKVLGTHPTRKEAIGKLKAIEISKHLKK